MILLIAGLFIGSEIGGTEGFFTGVGIVIITMVSVATIMIFIEISENVYKMRKNSDEVLKIMRNKK
jgi:hypothetical protein